MAKFTFDDKTSFELESGEEVVFKNLIVSRLETGGILMDLLNVLTLGILGRFTHKKWEANIAVTDRRIVLVPISPNSGNFPVETFSFSTITTVKQRESVEVANNEAGIHIYYSGKLLEFYFYPQGGYKQALSDSKSGKAGAWMAKVAASNEDPRFKAVLEVFKKEMYELKLEHIQKREFLLGMIDAAWANYKEHHK